MGTFTGYSAMSIARGLPDDGHLLCCDVSEEWTAIGRQAWAAAGVDDKIELGSRPPPTRCARCPTRSSSTSRSSTPTSPRTPCTTRRSLKRLRPNGVILVDNTLWGGRIIDAATERRVRPSPCARSTTRWRPTTASSTALLTLGDGLTLLRKR